MHARSGSGANHRRAVYGLVLASLVLTAAGRVADARQVDDRDRAVDWAIGGLEQGSRISRPGSAGAPAGASRGTRATRSPSDTGASRSGRAATGAGPGIRSTTGPISGQVSPGASQPPAGSGETQGGGSEPTGGTGGETSTGGETTGGGETTDSGTGIHVEADTSGGNLNAGVEVNTGETTLETGTAVETGTDTGVVDLGGQVDATTDISDTTLVGSAELTEPTPIDTTTSTELESTLSGGADEASVESSALEEPLGGNADDCTLLGLISCPSLP